MKEANNAITVGIARKRSSALRAQNVRDGFIMAMDGQPFEVAYYPRSFGPQYCVPASLFTAAFDVDWKVVTRFKMKFESEDSTDFKWFKGTVTSVDYSASRVWKCMEVIWDDPSRTEDCVNPWDVEPIFPPPNMPGPVSSINLPGLDSSKKSDSPRKVFGVKLNSEEQIWHGQLSGCQRQEEGTHEALELREGGSGYIGKGVSKALQNLNKNIGPALIGKNNDGPQKILGEQLKDLYKSFVTQKQSHGVVLSDTRSQFLAVGNESVIKFWDMDSVNRLMNTDAEGGLLASRCILFNKDGILLAVSASENGVKILANANGVRLMRSIENRSLDASRVNTGTVAKGAISCTFGTLSSAAGTSIGVADRSAQGTAMVALNGDCRSLSDVKPRITDEIEKSKFWKLTEIKDPSQLCFPDSLLSVRRVEKAMKEKSCNALLLKVNRIGSEAEKISKQVGWGVMARHHSGETEDTFIADLRWFVNGTGAPCRSERLAKNNQHMPNEEDTVSESNYAGTSFCTPVEPY
ncbi:uncharacterized protein LOC132313267 [Cornus florida]|uniref:uncharacterized protein LOC132313267 n=1 Tax=Cornus florida TaxID=4283 RepID=UPI002897AD04|nr:uncharacterized protein LOC132313267 [Cornus florida]